MTILYDLEGILVRFPTPTRFCAYVISITTITTLHERLERFRLLKLESVRLARGVNSAFILAMLPVLFLARCDNGVCQRATRDWGNEGTS